jgi:hypothetical protein
MSEDGMNCSLRQLLCAIGGFVLGIVLGVLFIIALSGKQAELADWVYKAVVGIIVASTCCAYVIGAKLFPASKFGSVNVSKIVWSIVGVLTLGCIAFVAITVMGR